MKWKIFPVLGLSLALLLAGCQSSPEPVDPAPTPEATAPATPAP